MSASPAVGRAARRMIKSSPIRIARDYNRTHVLPVRVLHVVRAAVWPPLSELWAWMGAGGRGAWLRPLAVGAALTMLVLPFDRELSLWLRGLNLRGDLRRMLEAWQQYGDFFSVCFAALVVLLLDPARARRVADLAAAAAGSSLACLAIKMFVGRPRPKFDDPAYFLGPWGVYPIDVTVDGKPLVRLAHAWDLGAGVKAQLWSMPSSHTAAAAALSVFLTALYPRFRWLGLAMIGVVALGRTALGTQPAHWPSDVVAGAAVGLAVSNVLVGGMWGSRLLERFVPRRPRAGGQGA